MNYIDLINKAWELREQGIITVHEHDLFNYLIHKSNRLNWKNPFFQPTKVICAVLGISRTCFTERRNRLKQLGLIKFKKGLTRKKPAEYILCDIELSTETEKKLRPGMEKNKKEKWQKPTPEEIAAYCKERHSEVNPQLFFDFYESKGWMVGNNKMKDWRAAVRSWETKLNKEKHQYAQHSNDRRYEIF